MYSFPVIYVCLVVCITICCLIVFKTWRRYSRYMTYSKDKNHKMKKSIGLFLCLTMIFSNRTNVYPRVKTWTVFPISRQGYSLEPFFNAARNGVNVPDEMRYEWLRLRSFSTFPLATSSHSPVRLARLGFSYTGREQDCVCFSCGTHISDWSGRNITEIHRRVSPRCRHLNGDNETNIPIGSRESFQPPNSHSEQTASEASNSHEETRQQTQPLEANCGSNSGNHTSVENQPSSNQRTNRLRDMLQPLGIVFERPRYPSYSVLATRVSSFQHWPSCLTQTPRNLSTAGFFYLGHGDHVRCFFCGGGLRNWDAGDDPWVEHARWFPKCPFLLQNRGTEFIQLVQRVHEELSENARSQNFSDIEQLPAAQKLQQMGYTWETIRKAYCQLKEKNPLNIKVEELIEELLKDDNAVPSVPEEKSNDNQHNEGQPENTCPASDQDETHATGTNYNNSTINSELSHELETVSLKEDETQSLIDENRRLKEQRLCKICMEEDISIAFLPCGHLCCCVHCAPAMRKCPICRAFIKGTVKTFPG